MIRLIPPARARAAVAIGLSCGLFFSLTSPSGAGDMDKRVESILQRMTLEEKIDYIGGYNAFYVRAVKRLGLPALKMADGPIGVRNYGPSTAYAGGIALAASWDVDLAARVGAMIGRDA